MTFTIKNTVYRDGTGVPLVLIHAFPVDHHMWDVCAHDIETLADQAGLPSFPIWAPDMPGAGEGPIPDPSLCGTVDDDGAYLQAMDILADSYVELLHQAGFEQAVWVGLSMGGYVMFDIHRRHPEAVAGLGICDTRADGETPEGRRRRLAVAQACEQGTVEPVMHFATPRPGDSSVKRSQECVQLFTRWIRGQRPEGVAWRQRMAAGRPDLTDQLPLITVPAAVVCGALDPSSPPRTMKAMAGAMTGTTVTYTQIEDCGHFSAVEHPDAVAQALVDLRARVEEKKSVAE